MEEIVKAFNRVEKQCNQMYGDIHGVTLYIKDMEQVSRAKSRSVPGWEEDYRNLKRIRHVRNALVHDDADADLDYSAADIAYLDSFYQRLLKRQDPLALVRKQNEKTKLRSTNGNDTRPVYEKGARKGNGCLVQAALLVCIILLFSLMVLAIWVVYKSFA